MAEQIDATWDVIYQIWVATVRSLSAKLADDIYFYPVEINNDQSDKAFYGYDWIYHGEFLQRIDYVKNNTYEFLMYGKSKSKSELHTLQMLDESISEEERAAIWILSFFLELDSQNLLRGRSFQIAAPIMSHTRQYLSRRFTLWGSWAKHFIPHVFFKDSFFENTEFNSFEPLIEIAAHNALFVLSNYKAVKYMSESKIDIHMPSIRIRQN